MLSDNENLKNEEKVMLTLLKRELFGIEEPLAEEVDWNVVVEESIDQSTFLSVFSHMDRVKNIPPEFREKIQKKSGSYMKANVTNFQWHGQVHQLMQKLGIPYCILKGAASAFYYPEPLLRQMGDVDFLVRREDLKQVGQLLESIGFTCIKMKEYHHHIDYEKGNVRLEVHFDPPGIPKGDAEPVIRHYLKDLLEMSHTTEELLFPVCVPSVFHHGLVMLLHLQAHLLGAGIGIRHLCDWAVFLHAIEEKEFLTLFQIPLQKMGLWKFTQIVSLTSVLAFGLEKQAWMGTDEDWAYALLVDIMAGGNHGRKDKQRVYEGMFISDSNRNSINKGRVSQFMNTVTQIVYNNWPIMKSWKVLLPFGWMMLCVRWMYRVLLGKRTRINYIKAYKNSSGRKELYQQLKVFEIEE